MPKPKLTESPWYWVYLFCTAAIIALVLMGPKFASRQAQIERKYQARQRAAQQVAGLEPNTPLSSEGQTAINLWPLYTLLGAGFIVSAGGMIWNQMRKTPQLDP